MVNETTTASYRVHDHVVELHKNGGRT